MNYILQIKGFWVAQNIHSFSVEEVGLYFYLLEITNKLNWMNPFKRNNSKVMADLGIKDRRTLDRYRNSLKQAGIIDFKSRNGDANVTYVMNDLSNFCTGFGTGNGIGYSTGDGIGNGTGFGIDNINKTVNKTKPSTSEAKASGANASSKKNQSKKEGPAAEFWPALVEVWFKFYREGPGHGENPTFEGQAPKSLRAIAELLKKRSINKGHEWTEQTATEVLAMFLAYAYKLEWLKDNFLLPNLERQFDKIVNQNGTATTKGGQSAATSLKKRLAAELSTDQG